MEKKQRLKSCGKILPRGEWKSPSSYLERCLCHEMRKVFNEAVKEIEHNVRKQLEKEAQNG